MNDLTKLKELAERATPGYWELDGRGVGPASDPNASIAKCSKREDAAYIAVANPQAILGLIAEVERIKAENEALRKDAERYRWMRDKCHLFDHYRSMTHVPNAFERSVDAAMKKDAALEGGGK